MTELFDAIGAVILFIGMVILGIVRVIAYVCWVIICGIGWSFYYLVHPHREYGEHLF